MLQATTHVYFVKFCWPQATKTTVLQDHTAFSSVVTAVTSHTHNSTVSALLTTKGASSSKKQVWEWLPLRKHHHVCQGLRQDLVGGRWRLTVLFKSKLACMIWKTSLDLKTFSCATSCCLWFHPRGWSSGKPQTTSRSQASSPPPTMEGESSNTSTRGEGSISKCEEEESVLQEVVTLQAHIRLAHQGEQCDWSQGKGKCKQQKD